MISSGDFMSFTKEDLKKFRKKYKKALEKKEYAFVFKEKDFVTGFAKYAIEYLEDKFK